MYSVYVFSREDAGRMNELGFELFTLCHDVAGKEIWVYIAKDVQSFSEVELPQGAVIKHGLNMNF